LACHAAERVSEEGICSPKSLKIEPELEQDRRGFRPVTDRQLADDDDGALAATDGIGALKWPRQHEIDCDLSL